MTRQINQSNGLINQSDGLMNQEIGLPVFYRSYSRNGENGQKESWSDVCERTIKGLAKLGLITDYECELVDEMQRSLKCLSSGRWLWVGGTPWSEKPENYPGAYNCTSIDVTSWNSFGLLMDLAMQGCGTGAVLLPEYLDKLPTIRNELDVSVGENLGTVPKGSRLEETCTIENPDETVDIFVGDSRAGWVEAYQKILELSSDAQFSGKVIRVVVHLDSVRHKGEPLRGFGGVSNPVKLPELFPKIAKILNGAKGRKLNSLECSLLIDEAMLVVVAGNIRRSAGIKQGAMEDDIFAAAKLNLWQQDEGGNWRIDPERDALRMSNHTRIYFTPPTRDEVIDAVRQQFYTGEGAIMWAGEAIARANCDLFPAPIKKDFLNHYKAQGSDNLAGYFKLAAELQGIEISDAELLYRSRIVGLNPCGEIILRNNFCNLSEVHLNNIDPLDFGGQARAFTAGGLSVAALLNHKFADPLLQQSREFDPIVGVSFTGLFDFFVKAFGVDWLRWWQAGRPEEWKAVDNLQLWAATNCFPEEPKGNIYKRVEAFYLWFWRSVVHDSVWDYCDRHSLKRPNRCTTVQPAGTKSLLTNASPGWHPPKYTTYLRRVGFNKNHPVALACMDYGFRVIPDQESKNSDGALLAENDIWSDRCLGWLVEIPMQVSWANLPGVDEIDVSKFSALAQFDFWLQVQQHYTTHNTSATIELTEEEIVPLGQRIYRAIKNDEGYVSAALLPRFNSPFPRLPFEPISNDVYRELANCVKKRRKSDDFHKLVERYHRKSNALDSVSGPAPCDSDKCLI